MARQEVFPASLIVFLRRRVRIWYITIAMVSFVFSTVILTCAGKWKPENLNPSLIFFISYERPECCQDRDWIFQPLLLKLVVSCWFPGGNIWCLPRGLKCTVTPCLHLKVSWVCSLRSGKCPKSPLKCALATTRPHCHTWCFKLPVRMRVDLHSSLSVAINRNTELQNTQRCKIILAGGS